MASKKMVFFWWSKSTATPLTAADKNLTKRNAKQKNLEKLKKNTPIEKEHHLNQTSMTFGFHINYRKNWRDQSW